MLDRGHQPVHRHRKAAVAAHRDDRPVGMDELGAERGRDRKPHRPGARRLQKPLGPLGLVEMRHHDAVLAGVAGDDRVVGQAAHQLADQPLRQDRLVVGEIGAVVEIAVALAMSGDAALCCLPAAGAARAALRGELAQNHRGVAEQHMLGRDSSTTRCAARYRSGQKSAGSGRAMPGSPRRCRSGLVSSRRRGPDRPRRRRRCRPRCRKCRTRPAPADGSRQRCPCRPRSSPPAARRSRRAGAIRHRPGRCARRCRR